MLDLSIIIPALNEANNLRELLPRLKEVLGSTLNINDYEILIVDANSRDGIEKVAEDNNVRLIRVERGYGIALSTGFKESCGKYIITMDADFSHSPYIIPKLYAYRHQADILIASRYVKKGYSSSEFVRDKMSRVLNFVYRTVLSLPIKDMSSGFRLYNRRIFDEIKVNQKNYVALQEILMKSYACGFTIKEIPFHYYPRKYGSSKSRLFQFGMEYLVNLCNFWRLRNSLECADYEERAFYSRVWFQKYWQRKRYSIIVDYCKNFKSILDIGCGSNQILDGLPQSIGCDIEINKLRYVRGPFRNLVQADVHNLPFKDDSFDACILSQVIEHLPQNPAILDEVVRVNRKNGYIIIGMPDYDTHWYIIEKLYKLFHPMGAYDEHLTRYTKQSIINEMEKRGCKYCEHKYIFGAELIIKFQKTA